jgi:hypothetical protein
MDRATRALRPDEAKESAVQKSSEVPAQYQAPALRGSTRVAPQAGLMAAVSPPLRAMLRVSDRTESERAIRELVGRLGATALWDTPEPSVVTITMTRARLAELLIGLRELGDLKMDARGDELPDRVTLLLRLGS